ncbi:hypothetical protein GCM10023185_29020 [Hymenobacter saemangeumensis]|uniref:Uncharacterized protein n=1 Tax=Hymenobacter saemangeumensis TaxID=1084522 RepID=A0ABP8ILF9_9BACT
MPSVAVAPAAPSLLGAAPAADTATRLEVATTRLNAARAAYQSAPFEECSTASPLWAALGQARAAHLAAWSAHRRATCPAPVAPAFSLRGTSPLGLLFHAGQQSQ